MTSQHLLERPTRSRSGARSGWRLAVGLILLSAIPLSAGVLRLVQLAGGPESFPTDPRFDDAFPVALVVHIAGAAIFAFVGALQFVARFRRRHPRWHRRAGRVLVVAGLLVVGSALWLTLFYRAQPGSGRVLFVVRLLVAPAMAVCLVRGFAAIRRRDIAGHRDWMIRAYALGLGAGTQVFTEGIGEAIFGQGVLAGDLEKSAAWIINIAVAEWAIRRPASRPRTRATTRARATSVRQVDGAQKRSTPTLTTVRTERLTLRPATPEDAGATWSYRRLPEVGEWLTEIPADLSGYQKAFADPERLGNTVIVESEGRIVGDFMLRVEDGWAQTEIVDHGRRTQAELGWVLDPTFTGRGYATEAVQALLRFCFEDLGVRRVVANCFLDNDASWRLMERVGMRREAHAIAESLHRTGRWLDTVAYAVLADEWVRRT